MSGKCQRSGPPRKARLYWFVRDVRDVRDSSGWVGVGGGGRQQLPIPDWRTRGSAGVPLAVSRVSRETSAPPIHLLSSVLHPRVRLRPGFVWPMSRIGTLTEGPSLLVCHGCQGCLPPWRVGGGGGATADCGLRNWGRPFDVQRSMFDVRCFGLKSPSPFPPPDGARVSGVPPSSDFGATRRNGRKSENGGLKMESGIGSRISDFFRFSVFGLRIS
jgi:hypothetical protein